MVSHQVRIEESHVARGARSASRRHPGAFELGPRQAAFARVDPDVSSDDTISLDHALSYAHRALNALLHQYRMPTHGPEAFGRFYDAAEVPFRELM